MTAPAAPRIYANQDGTNIYVRWLPVPTATDYNLYVQEAGLARGIEAQLDAVIDLNDDGWFFYIVGPYAGVVTVDVTALNIGAEESVPSNTVQKNLRGAGAMEVPSDALAHRRKTAAY